MGAKKIVLVAGGALLLLQQSGLLDDLWNPPEDDEYDDYDDYDDPYERDPYGDMMRNILTGLGMHAASELLEKAMKKRTKANAKKNPATDAKAKASVKPKVGAGVKPASAKVASSVATKTATQTAEKATGKIASEAVEKAGVKAAKSATKATTAVASEATSAVAKAGTEAATKGATVASKSAAKAAKGSTLVSKLKGTPADLIVMVIAQVLIAVLDLDPESFKACESGEFDLAALPDWANAIIGAVPFLGDLFDLIGNKMCLRAGCPNGTQDENGLCYKVCDPGFKSDGATMCYKQYPDFENNGMGHTITSITKKILMDTGRIPSSCDDSEDKVGLLCYEKPPQDWINVAGTIWQTCPSGYTDTGVRCENNVDVGAGRIPGLTDCPGGWTDDGVLCREPITMSSCPGGWADDGLTCREPITCDPIHPDGCCSKGLFGECYGCLRGGDCHGGTVINKTLSGGRVDTKTQKGVGDWEERIDGLNYNKCPDGFGRVPGMPYLCSKSFTKQSRVLAPRSMKCPQKPVVGVLPDGAQRERETEIAGLCYNDIPAGYSRKTLGLLDQDCPAGSQDFGVGCTRQAYNRGAGLIPLGIKFKDRK
jgi:hypothetical protein